MVSTVTGFKKVFVGFICLALLFFYIGSSLHIANAAMEDTTTSVIVSPEPSVHGEPVQITAVVEAVVSDSGTPTGTVTFTGAGLNETVPLDGSGQAVVTTSSLTTGTITATYSGDGLMGPSVGTAAVTVSPAATTTSVQVTPSPSIYGQSVVLSATVTVEAPGSGIPSGTVTFTGPGLNETVSLSNAGQAELATTSLSTGTITAYYNGSGSFTSSSGTTGVTILPAILAGTTTTVTVAPNPSNSGELVTLNAIVAPQAGASGIPSGTVTFTGPGGFNVTVGLSGTGEAGALLPAFASGTITATYNGDSVYQGSTGSAPITVNAAPVDTVTTVTATPDPSFTGQLVTITATVSALNLMPPVVFSINPLGSSVDVPTGTVTFTGPGGLNQTLTLNAQGQATMSTSLLQTGTIAVVYNGDSQFNSSTGTKQVTVNTPETTTTVTAAPDPSIAGQPVTITATVASNAPVPVYTLAAALPMDMLWSIVTPNTGVPTGTVTFTGPGGLNETVVLNGQGQASFTSTTLVTGTITAAYSGDGIYNGSTGTVDVTVTAPAQSEDTAPPVVSGGGGAAPAPAPSGFSVLVNGKAEEAGTLSTSNVNGQPVSTLKIDQAKLESKLQAEGQGAVVTVPVNLNSDVIVTSLNGQMVQQLEDKQAILEIKTGQASYTLPAGQLQMSSLSEKFGQSVALQDITVTIQISKASGNAGKAAEQAAAQRNFSLVTTPVDFTITASYGSTSVEVETFSTFVQRTIALPQDVDPNRITTGVVVDPDGTVRHIPTKVTLEDGQYSAVLNSMTNSSYSVVWHPLEFRDVAAHWAKDAVNDMGSRMVIEGTGDNGFSPDRTITRAEFASIFVRGLGLKLEGGAAAFSDVSASDWYGSAVQTAYSYGLIGGFEDGTFRPEEDITREQAMVMVSRAMMLTGLQDKLHVQADALAAYLDAAEASEWARDGIAGSVQAGLITGRDGNMLAPKESITRAEVATVIQRLLQKSGLI